MLWPVVLPGYKWRLPPTPDRAALRSLIPFELSHALAVAVERALSGPSPLASGMP